ncbi:MAG: elongation factor P [Patescibacteria group bacterium]
MITDAGNIKKGDFIRHQDEIWQVQKTEFNYQGRGMANSRIKIKSVRSGKNIDLTVKSNASIDVADVETIEMQFLYKDAENLYFMHPRTFQQYSVSLQFTGDFHRFLKDGDKYYVLLYNDLALSVRPPGSVRLKVIQTEDAVRGDTVSGAKKKAIVESGVTIMVPLFVKVGDMLAINPETGAYVERVKS